MSQISEVPKPLHCTIDGGTNDATLDRELPTYRPLFWFELPDGPRREALRLEQEKPGYEYFNR